MKRATLFVNNPVYLKGAVFDANSPANRDDWWAFFRDLRESFKKRGYHLETQDVHPIETSDLVVYNDMPRHRPALKWADKSHLMIFESQLIRAKNWSKWRHRAFRRILTWNDDWVDNQKYFKFNFAHRFPEKIQNTAFDRPKLCGMISSSHLTIHPLELYSERVKTMQWFEKFHPDEFVLYGRGWDRILFTGPIPVRMLNHVPKMRNWMTPPSPLWRGPVKNKMETYNEFRFAVCYENAKDITGYITEKIFDCFFAGVVPIYWGPANIASVIPEECYVDRRRFQSHEELFAYLRAMSETEYAGRLRAIAAYLKSEKAAPFRAEVVAEQVASVVTGGSPIL